MYFILWVSKGLYLECQTEAQVLDYINANQTGDDLPVIVKGEKLIPLLAERANIKGLISPHSPE